MVPGVIEDWRESDNRVVEAGSGTSSTFFKISSRTLSEAYAEKIIHVHMAIFVFLFLWLPTESQ
jgi:hypothetical protein